MTSKRRPKPEESYRQYTVSRKHRAPLVQFILAALKSKGCRIIQTSSPDRAQLQCTHDLQPHVHNRHATPTEPRTTREYADRKIADSIRNFDQLRTEIPTGPILDLEDKLDILRRHAIELLRSLFDHYGPADEFDNETAQSVFYTDPPEYEQRQDLDDNIRRCINQLRSLTARLDFYQPPTDTPPTLQPAPNRETTPQSKSDTRDHPPSLVALLLFIGVLLAIAALVLWQQRQINTLPPIGAFILFLVVALIAAILLFGLFQNTAKVTGTLLGFPIVFTGPAALFFVVLILGLWWNSRTSTKVGLPATDTPATTATTGTTATTATTGTTGTNGTIAALSTAVTSTTATTSPTADLRKQV